MKGQSTGASGTARNFLTSFAVHLWKIAFCDATGCVQRCQISIAGVCYCWRRCRRFSMYVVDQVIRIINVEQPGEFGETSAETLVKQIAALENK